MAAYSLLFSVTNHIVLLIGANVVGVSTLIWLDLILPRIRPRIDEFLQRFSYLYHHIIYKTLPTIMDENPIYAYRCWHLHEQRLVPISLIGKLNSNLDQDAVCAQGHNHGPQIEAACTCGYWSLKSLDDAVEIMITYQADVVALVRLEGRVIEHESGYRSQRIIPIALHVSYLATLEKGTLRPPSDIPTVPSFWGLNLLGMEFGLPSASRRLQANSDAATPAD